MSKDHEVAIKRLITLAEERGEFLQLEDGYLYYAPSLGNGALSPWMLRAIADELDRRNAPWDEQIQNDPALSAQPSDEPK